MLYACSLKDRQSRNFFFLNHSLILRWLCIEVWLNVAKYMEHETSSMSYCYLSWENNDLNNMEKKMHILLFVFFSLIKVGY